MKKYMLLVFLFLAICGWMYKREIALTLLPIALNISTQLLITKVLNGKNQNPKKTQINQISYLFWQMTWVLMTFLFTMGEPQMVA
jgi:hypothetical protein